MTTYYSNQNDIDLGFGLEDVEANPFDLIPAGFYTMQAVGVELKQTKAGNNMVAAQFQIIGGQYDNRRVFVNFNIQHSNPETVKWAQQALKQWTMACGATGNERMTMGLIESMEGREFIGKVTVKESTNPNYSDSNNITSYRPVNPHAQPIMAQAAPMQPPAPQRQQNAAPMPPVATKKGPMPWEGKRA